MVTPETSQAILQAILDTYPDEGVVLGVNFRRGWGDTVFVDVHTGPDPLSGIPVNPRMELKLRSAIKQQLGDERHHIRFGIAPG